MMTTLGRIYEKEKQEAIREAEERAAQAERLSSIRNIMEDFGVSAERAMDTLRLPEAERQRYLAML